MAFTKYIVSYWYEGFYTVNGPDGEVANGLTYRAAQRLADRLNAELETRNEEEENN